MTDKVEKIREELERLREQLQNKVETSDFIAGEVFIMNYFLTFINSLQEEPVSKIIIEGTNFNKSWYAHPELAFKAGANWQKEQFEKNRLKHCDSITNEQAELEQVFIDQHLDKYQRMPTFLDAIEYGMNLQKKQMMKEAVEGKIVSVSTRLVQLFKAESELMTDNKFKWGDKVKVLVVKEE